MNVKKSRLSIPRDGAKGDDDGGLSVPRFSLLSRIEIGDLCELRGASFARGAQIQIVGLCGVLTLKIRHFKF